MADELSFGEYIDTFYKVIGPDAERDPEIQDLLKADDRYDYGSTDYFNPVYSYEIALEGLTRSTNLYRLLPKTTYIDKGDSLHNIIADATYMKSFLGEEGGMFVSDTVIPTVSDLDLLWPAVFHIGWEDTRIGREMAKFQKGPKTDLAFLKQFFNRVYADGIDQQLAGTYLSSTVHGVDTPATQYSKATIECIDRMISNSTESGAATHVSAATDGDIYWDELNLAGTSTIKINRSDVTWADAQIKLPAAAATEDAYNILDELDDLMAVALSYADTGERSYIGLCSPKAMNKIQDEVDPKQRFLEFPMDVYQTIGGVSTRPGRMGGKTSVAALAICGEKIPFFTSPYLGGVSTTWVWENSKYTTGGVGNVYLINMNAIELRHLIPISYVETPNYSDWILGNRHSIFSAMQLLCSNFASHAALKYIKA
jgi:hypothetical protein